LSISAYCQLKIGRLSFEDCSRIVRFTWLLVRHLFVTVPFVHALGRPCVSFEVDPAGRRHDT
jgi:hypothetical protein